MRTGSHSHPCFACRTPVECCGDIEQNYDGFPEFVCREYHLEGGGFHPEFLCESCQSAEDREQAERRVDARAHAEPLS